MRLASFKNMKQETIWLQTWYIKIKIFCWNSLLWHGTILCPTHFFCEKHKNMCLQACQKCSWWWVKILVNGFRNLLTNKLIKQSSPTLRTNGLGMWFRRSRTSFNLWKDDFNSAEITTATTWFFFSILMMIFTEMTIWPKKVFKVARVQP